MNERKIPLKNPDGRFDMDNDFSLAKSLQPEKPYPEMHMTRRGKAVMGLGFAAAGAAMFIGAGGGQPGSVDKAPLNPTMQEIADTNGGNSADLHTNPGERFQDAAPAATQPTPSDIRPVGK